MAEHEKSDREIKAEIDVILAENELLREEAHEKGLAFSAPTEEQLEKKLRGETSSSPIVIGQSWTTMVPLGGICTYAPYIRNPDPTPYNMCFVSVFFAPCNFFDSAADMVISQDPRFPQVNSAPFSLPGNGGTAQPSFFIPIPSTVERSTYLANALVWQGNHHAQGTCFDRALIYVTVT